jgi:ABC-type branched-subunit amino acid transport system substrate-binding protein
MADHAVNDWGKKRIAVFYVNDDYGKKLAEKFEVRIEEIGGRIVSSTFHRNKLDDWDRRNIASVLARLRTEESPDLFVLFQRRQAARETISLIRDAGMDADILGGENIGYGEHVPKLDGRYDGVRVATFYLRSESNRAGMEFDRKYRESTGMIPQYSLAYAYDAVYLFRDAVLHGGFSREGVKKHLDRLIEERTVIEGVTGRYILGPDRNALRPFYIAEIKDGVYHHLKTVPPPEPTE